MKVPPMRRGRGCVFRAGDSKLWPLGSETQRQMAESGNFTGKIRKALDQLWLEVAGKGWLGLS